MRSPQAAPLRFVAGVEGGWQQAHPAGLRLHLRACGSTLTAQKVASMIAAAGAQPELLGDVFASIDGRFVIVVEGPGWIAGAVDRIRSAPLLVANTGLGCVLGMHAPSVLAAIGGATVDEDGALALAMGGFTIGDATLYHGVRQLRPGEWVLARDGGEIVRSFYRCWRPWLEDDRSPDSLEQRLVDVTQRVLERMIALAAGRQIVLPLSAGLDSRLIASGCKVLGARDVVCFAYGPAGSSEVETSRAIAARLGYPWRHVMVTPARMRTHFEGALFDRFFDFADAGCATPFTQDLFIVAELLADGWLSHDAVVVNGQTGDFISGNHVPDELNRLALGEAAGADARSLLLGSLQRKHFALWESLRTPERSQKIDALLLAQLAATAPPPIAASSAAGLFEHLEFIDRQSKYVIAGQRGYEFHGLRWSLPLWDDPYLDFWASVPRAARCRQDLYRRTLVQLDWGGVWRDIPVNRKRVRPRWAALARAVAKPAFALAPRRHWLRFEKNVIEYWTDVVANYAIRPYRKVALDRRGHRNAVAWLTEAYLARHGLDWNGFPARRVEDTA